MLRRIGQNQSATVTARAYRNRVPMWTRPLGRVQMSKETRGTGALLGRDSSGSREQVAVPGDSGSHIGRADAAQRIA